jgi:hypothetical protein
VAIPDKIRKIENLHILFWLGKDLCWCMVWKPLGMIMIVPTLSLCLFTTWKMRNDLTELYHNIAVLLWIIANSYWMSSEFFGFDEKLLVSTISGKDLAIIPFGLGILILVYFYLIVKRKFRVN